MTATSSTRCASPSSSRCHIVAQSAVSLQVRATSTSAKMSMVAPDPNKNFQHILRLLNTNVSGNKKIMFALTEIKGVGRRYSNVVLKKADIDLNKRAGELNSDELERVVTILQSPQNYKIPMWMLNRQKDIVDGKYSHIVSNALDSKYREDSLAARATEEDPQPPWPASLLGSPCAWSAYKDNRSSWKDSRCLEEEGLDDSLCSLYASSMHICSHSPPPFAVTPVRARTKATPIELLLPFASAAAISPIVSNGRGWDVLPSQPWIEIVASKIIDPEKGERGTVMLILLEAVIVGPSSFMPDWPFDGTCCQAKTSYRLRINLETGSVRNTNTLTYRSCKSESGMTPDQRFPACPKSYVPEPPFVAFCDWAARSMQYLTWPVGNAKRESYSSQALFTFRVVYKKASFASAHLALRGHRAKQQSPCSSSPPSLLPSPVLSSSRPRRPSRPTLTRVKLSVIRQDLRSKAPNWSAVAVQSIGHVAAIHAASSTK
ncbi:uncharacterized protein L969DRAFT_92397 [Mixia osmundae IAM 14324]|uniref:40S ribosomal protein S18 n=1 Tax=Mixia osmundae (strain CBS 9802 / IAM 14324 / JCM 22182 / KY 12970) TaxID=764103 RepID=G7DXN3_MIXOS|nr:uncharacterized protein L969DRAFT_92397 [Mixia osmundae IAM 14324]KEI41164.1 hypothetical protein L969DRAFT_92397 [Mixia osmundae IAM 14324]GAA95343.1 hypothetical protein E5Q_01999 [Mixia osmundae IAM 14324]